MRKSWIYRVTNKILQNKNKNRKTFGSLGHASIQSSPSSQTPRPLLLETRSMSPEQSKTQWSCNAHTPPPRPPKSVPKHQYIQLALDSACPRVHTWCAEYRICSPHLHLITSHGSVPSLDQWGQSSSPCWCHLSQPALLRDWPNWAQNEGVTDTHLEKPGFRGNALWWRHTNSRNQECGHWGYWHGHAHIKDAFAQDFIHSHIPNQSF